MTGRFSLVTAIILAVFSAPEVMGLSITAAVDVDEIELGNQVNLSVTINGAGGSLPDPVLPDLSDFDVYSSGSNRSFTMVNGAFSSTLELNYVLMPKRTGNLTIGPIVVASKGERVQSGPIRISVKETGSMPPGQREKSRTQSARRGAGHGDFFIEQTVDKNAPFVGEQVTLTFRFYQAVNLWDQPNLEWPEYSGFTVEDLPPNTRSYQYVDGKRYLVTEIKRALFPIAPGRLTIETPQLTVKSDDAGGMTDPFGVLGRDFFRRSKPTVLKANAILINVRPLPEKGRPADFSGAVGRFEISAQVDRDSAGVDEPVTLKIVLSGTGNIKSLQPVEIPELSDFRVYESGKTESINSNNYVISGRKTFELAVIPKTSGSFVIPAFHYGFFNPRRSRYETVSTQPLQIIATGEGLADVGGAPRYIIGGDRKSFEYIITEFPNPHSGLELSIRLWFWLLQSLPFMGIIAALAVRSHYRKLLGDRSYSRRIKAARRARSILKAALAERDSGQYSEFCGHLHEAVVGFIADRLDLEKSGLTTADIRDLIPIPQEIREDLSAFLDECQTARFARLNFDGSKADELLARAADMMARLEKAI